MLRLAKRPLDHYTIDSIKRLVLRAFEHEPAEVQKIAEGAFGIIYRVLLSGKRSPVIVKVFKYPGLGARERNYLSSIESYLFDSITVPAVLHYEKYDIDRGIEEALVMDCIPGTSGSTFLKQNELNEDQVSILRENVISVMSRFHRVTHSKGFGALEGPFQRHWWDHYRQRVAEVHSFLHDLRARDRLGVSEKVLDVADRAFDLGPQIFASHRPVSSLMHGDFCLGNIIIDPNTLNINGVIDPLQVEWGDRELDSIHLTKSNGHVYRLYEGFKEQYCREQAISVDDPGLRLRYWYYSFWAWLSYFVVINLDGEGWYDVCAERLNNELDRHFGR